MAKILASGLCALALLVPQLVARAADVFWMPIHDGQRLAFLQSGTIVNSDGSGSTWGPEAAELQIQAVDRSLLGQHADWRLLDGDTRFTGTYLAQTAAGLFRISEGDPAVDAVYRYYTDPQPWLYLTAPLDPGASLGFAGLRRGQWAVPGGGFEAWSGTWSANYLHLGRETVTTPLGIFDALKLQVRSVSTVDTRALFPKAKGRATWDELRWFAPGFGYVKIEGSGLDETDFDGDGIVDRWQRESQTILAVPEPAAAWSLAAGLAVLALLLRGRRRAV